MSENQQLEKTLWLAADKMRSNMDAAEYKHVVLGLIFLKYISDAFEEMFQKLTAQKSEGADPEDKNEYTAEKFSTSLPRRDGNGCRDKRSCQQSVKM